MFVCLGQEKPNKFFHISRRIFVGEYIKYVHIYTYFFIYVSCQVQSDFGQGVKCLGLRIAQLAIALLGLLSGLAKVLAFLRPPTDLPANPIYFNLKICRDTGSNSSADLVGPLALQLICYQLVCL